MRWSIILKVKLLISCREESYSDFSNANLCFQKRPPNSSWPNPYPYQIEKMDSDKQEHIPQKFDEG